MTKSTLRTLLRFAYWPSFVLPLLAIAVAYFFQVYPSAGLTLFMIAFAGIATCLATPPGYQSVNWDKAIPRRENYVPLLGMCLAPMAYTLQGLYQPTEMTAMNGLSMILWFMIAMIVAMVSGFILSWRMSARYKDEYQAFRKAKNDEALKGQIEALIATLPVMYQDYVANQLKDATPDKIAEVAQAIQTLQKSAPHLLNTK